MKILIFSLNNEYYATDIIDVERILGYQQTTVLPEVPDFLEGVINYENNILPVISLAKRFEFYKELEEDSKIIVVKDNDLKIGIVVDNVYEVTDINEEMIEEPPAIGNAISKRYMKGLVRIEDKIVILLNLSNVLSDDEKSKIG